MHILLLSHLLSSRYSFLNITDTSPIEGCSLIGVNSMLHAVSPSLAPHLKQTFFDNAFAILQARDALVGTAQLEAVESLSHQDCIMLTCTPCGRASSADSADTWRAITLRLTSAYPTEPPSLVVRTSKDSPHAPQVHL